MWCDYLDPNAEPCMCDCHWDGKGVLHCFPCCDLCYQKFISKDGVVDQLRLNKLIQEAYHPTPHKQRWKDKK